MQYRNTPSVNNFSPAQMLMSRHTRNTLLPVNIKQFEPKLINKKLVNFEMKQKQIKQAEYYNKKQGVRDLKPLLPGTNAFVQLKPQSEWTNCKIICKLGARRYKISTQNGKQFVRNRRFIRPSILKTSFKNDNTKSEHKVTWEEINLEPMCYELQPLNNPLNNNNLDNSNLCIGRGEESTSNVENPESSVNAENAFKVNLSNNTSTDNVLPTTIATSPSSHSAPEGKRESPNRKVSRKGRNIIRPARLNL